MFTKDEFRQVVEYVSTNSIKDEISNSIDLFNCFIRVIHGNSSKMYVFSKSFQKGILVFYDKWIKAIESWNNTSKECKDCFDSLFSDFVELHDKYLTEVIGEVLVKEFIVYDELDIE